MLQPHRYSLFILLTHVLYFHTPPKGVPLLPGRRRVTVYNTTLSDGSNNTMGLYNHGPMVIYALDTFLCAWYNAPLSESHNMRVLLAASPDLSAGTVYFFFFFVSFFKATSSKTLIQWFFPFSTWCIFAFSTWCTLYPIQLRLVLATGKKKPKQNIIRVLEQDAGSPFPCNQFQRGRKRTLSSNKWKVRLRLRHHYVVAVVYLAAITSQKQRPAVRTQSI